MSSKSDPDLGKIISDFPPNPSAPPLSDDPQHAIYPDLSHFLGNLDDDGTEGVMNGCRAKIIADAVAFLNHETTDRTTIGKKYKKALSCCDHGSRGLTIVGAGCNTSAVVVLGLPGVGGIVSLALASVSLGTTIFGGLLTTVSKTFQRKYKKHEALRVLAASKLSSVVNYIGSISANKQLEARDVKVILQEVDDYKHQKSLIRKEYRQKHGKSQPLEKKEIDSIMTMGRESVKRDLFRFIESESDRKTQAGMAKIANKL